MVDSTEWTVTSTDGIHENVPEVTKLNGNYPNPFNPETTISYSLATDENVSIFVYNASGKMVASLVNGNQKAGNHNIRWNGSTATSGIYFIRMKAGNYSRNIKAMLVK